MLTRTDYLNQFYFCFLSNFFDLILSGIECFKEFPVICPIRGQILRLADSAIATDVQIEPANPEDCLR